MFKYACHKNQANQDAVKHSQRHGQRLSSEVFFEDQDCAGNEFAALSLEKENHFEQYDGGNKENVSF